ncbi:alpha/beta hydrolase [Clostridium sp. AF32-12BH]|uniref:alpha/beta hydrolase n=1 Tax=Clostridium sp. AF32-12BH TaxID=2292006 RepID=UPI000E50E6BB|nr:alpha/beta hydrolase [Clostridium sp. AF32-12BH]RHP42125.1 alpha/beta hydrolase [Clostridium sp. AF32-12BH]
MALSQEERKHWEDVIRETGGTREIMLNSREIPEKLSKCRELVERTEMMLPVEKAGIPDVRIVITKALDRKDGCPVHVNCHGGGFVFPQGEDDDYYCAHIASGIHGIVVDVDYAVGPDHPFPTAFEQSYAAVQWAFSQCENWHADEKRVSMGGQSAGGNLTAAVALRANESKDFQLCLQVLAYAAMNFQTDPASRPETTPGAVERMRAFDAFYTAGDKALNLSPFVSPGLATDAMIKDLPSTLIITAGRCNLRFEDEAYGMRLVEAGTEVTMKRFLNSRHGFAGRMVDEWWEAQECVIHAILGASL